MCELIVDWNWCECAAAMRTFRWIGISVVCVCLREWESVCARRQGGVGFRAHRSYETIQNHDCNRHSLEIETLWCAIDINYCDLFFIILYYFFKKFFVFNFSVSSISISDRQSNNISFRMHHCLHRITHSITSLGSNGLGRLRVVNRLLPHISNGISFVLFCILSFLSFESNLPSHSLIKQCVRWVMSDPSQWQQWCWRHSTVHQFIEASLCLLNVPNKRRS